ncbi:hypothetical protein [Frigidibacter sp. ROC022]|uniref:hypothetical protein n=1 Tax=Frigidibacter sp. ROC022 TaxID=2971796 RepID=UPI00215A7BD8|nr:hypothetical protein [Frigidibacter sp. ROC022]MCR8725618.1 hypothetical protein [Frigidibacter sp. ROC022]
MTIGNSVRFGGAFAALALMLGGCAPGDLGLSQEDLVARNQGVWVAETDSQRIAYHGTAKYVFDCLSGTAISQASGRVTSVTGVRNRTDDYRISVTPVTRGNRAIATVTHVGNAALEDRPWVTVEMKALCTRPVPAS